jgi:uncharacterized protein YdhG (YjbR/CyaY superfamily)
MKNYSAKDVDAFIASSDKEARPKLKELRELITSTIPKVEEGISWGIPFYKYHGLLAGFAPFKKHVSFGFCAVLQSEDREMLEKKGYKTGSKTIQITFDQKVPTAVIRQMLKAQVKKIKPKVQQNSHSQYERTMGLDYGKML